MSFRLLTTALLLLMSSSSQKPADLPQDGRVTCAPCEGVLDSNSGTLVDLLAQVQEAGRGAPGYPILLIDPLAGNRPTAPVIGAGLGKLVQAEDRSENDVFPLNRLEVEADQDIIQANFVEPQIDEPAFNCRELGLSMLHQICPPLRLCPACQVEGDPCVELAGCMLRKCGSLWSKAVAQSQGPCNQGCPYYHPRACPIMPTPIDPPGDEEEAEEVPTLTEAADCDCCNQGCSCETRCACTKKADCSCCDKACACKAKCACKDCDQADKCGCAADKCGCKDGDCSCKSVKVKKACGSCCSKSVKAKVEKKCVCKDCKENQCACGKCGCTDGSCSCKSVKVKKACGEACQVKQAAKCACKDCVECQCADGDCGCQDQACQCGTPSACPHLNAVRQAKSQPKDNAPSVAVLTPLENLERISRARELCGKAEKLHQAGAYERAEKCYRKAQELAPGSRYDGIAKVALAAIEQAKQEQQVAGLSLIERARQALKEGKHDEAYQLAEQAYAEAYTTMSQAQALLRVIDAERFDINADDVEESEPVDGPCAPLPCEPSGCVQGSTPIAVEVQVAECLEAAQRALAAGCFTEAQTYAEMALRLDPSCSAAQYLADKARQLIGYEEEQEEPTDACYPESGEEPCEVDPEAPTIGLYPAMPTIDPAIAAVLERLSREIDTQSCPAGEEEAEAQDWQILDLYIDPEECDGYAPPQQGTEADEPPLADAGELFRQLVQAVSGGHCIEVDTGTQGPRLWIQLGAAQCRWSVKGAGTISFAPCCEEQDETACAGVESAGGCQQVKVDVGGPCEISIHIKWAGTGSAGVPQTMDTRAWQEAHEREVLRWIESMNSGEPEQCEPIDYDDCTYYPCD